MSRDTIKKLVTPNGDSMVDEANDALRVNMVAGTVTISGADGALQDGVDPLIKATIKDYTNSNPLAVITVDTNGDPVGGSAGLTDAQLRATPVPTSTANLDVSLSTRLKPADTLTAVTTVGTITNVVHVDDNASTLSVDDGAGSLTIDGTVAVSNFPVSQAVTGTFFQATQPVSGTFFQATQPVSIAAAVAVTDNAGSLTVDNTGIFAVQAAQSGTWTVQPGNTANTTAWKVDGSAVTQPVSGTVTANQGTANATPWNVSTIGTKTNNNATPGATNLGTLPVLANAALPVWTEGNLVSHSTDLSGGLRVVSRPPIILGAYRAHVTTAGYAGLAANSTLISFRYTAAALCIITRVRVFVTTQTAATVAGRIDRALMVVRSFTVADTGGTAITLTSPFGKLRTSHAATGVGNIMVLSGGALTKGTGTEDATPFGVIATAGVATEGVGLTLPKPGMDVDLFQYNVGQNYPLILAQNEGFRISIPTAMPTTIAQITAATIEWYEVTASTF